MTATLIVGLIILGIASLLIKDSKDFNDWKNNNDL